MAQPKRGEVWLVDLGADKVRDDEDVIASTRDARSTRIIGLETVADTRFGFDQTRFGRVGFDFLAEMGDVNAEVLAVFLGFRAPDLAQDMAMGENAAGMAERL